MLSHSANMLRSITRSAAGLLLICAVLICATQDDYVNGPPPLAPAAVPETPFTDGGGTAPTIDSAAAISTAETPSNMQQTSAAAAAPAPEGERKASCGFLFSGARYFRARAEATLQGATNDTLLNDALVRMLRSRLLVAPCQLRMGQGVPCTSGTQQLPCSNPTFHCSNGVIISSDVYDAVIEGDCENEATKKTLVCDSIAVNPEITRAILTGQCRPSCISGTGATGPQNLPMACVRFPILVDAPSREEAERIAGTLATQELQNTVTTDLGGYSSSPLTFLIVDSSIETAVGWGFFPPPPPPPPPLKPLASAEDLSTGSGTNNMSGAARASEASLSYGPWSSCVPSCGKGFSTRTAQCFAPDGTLLPLLRCPGGSDAQTSQPCSEPCGAAYWTYGPWSTCNATCGGGWATRTASCQSADGSQCVAEELASTELPCNTAPCTTHTWAMTDWGKCSVECGGGERRRNVTCVDARGRPADVSACTDVGGRPASTEPCNIEPCDFCASTSCLGRGSCSNGACSCRRGYSGTYCENPPSCKSNVVDAELNCCSSGLANVHGQCCQEGSRLDKDGECCEQSLDPCGVCGGSNLFIDMQGNCCPVADANGLCCPSGRVDECGVCDGMGNSCDIMLTARIDVPADLVMGNSVQDAQLTAFFQGALAELGLPAESVSVGQVSLASPTDSSSPSGRRLLSHRSLHQDAEGNTGTPLTAGAPPPQEGGSSGAPVSLLVNVEITASKGSNVTGGDLSSAFLAAALPAAASSSAAASASNIALVDAPTPGRIAVCGNEICEIGERASLGAQNGSCPDDCNLPARTCPQACGAGGSCHPASGLCQCHVGYSGPTCSHCSPGFLKSGDVCVASVMSLDLLNPNVVNEQGEAIVSGEADGDSGLNAGLIAAAVIGGLLGLVVLIVLFVYLRKRLARRNASAYLDDKYASKCGFDEEIGLRQKYGSVGSMPRNGSLSTNGTTSYGYHVDVTATNDDLIPAAPSAGVTYHSARESRQQHRPAQLDPGMNDARLAMSARASSSAAVCVPAREMHHQSVARESLSWGGGSLPHGPANTSPSLDHQRCENREGCREDPHGALMTSSIVDPEARLFFNPAFDAVDEGPRQLRASVAPGYATAAAAKLPHEHRRDGDVESSRGSYRRHQHQDANMRLETLRFGAPLSAREPSREVLPVESSVQPRPVSARSAKSGASEAPADRRARLEALRAAVRNLETHAAERGGLARPGSSADQEFHQPQRCLDGDEMQPQQQSGDCTFLPGRPAVPRLHLANLHARRRVAGKKPAAESVGKRDAAVPASNDGLIKAHPAHAAAGLDVENDPVAVYHPHQARNNSPGAIFNRLVRKVAAHTAHGRSALSDGDALTEVPPSAEVTQQYHGVMAVVDGVLQKERTASARGDGSARGSGRAIEFAR